MAEASLMLTRRAAVMMISCGDGGIITMIIYTQAAAASREIGFTHAIATAWEMARIIASSRLPRNHRQRVSGYYISSRHWRDQCIVMTRPMHGDTVAVIADYCARKARGDCRQDITRLLASIMRSEHFAIMRRAIILLWPQ